MSESHPTWIYRLARDEVPEVGLHVDLVADEAVRVSLAGAAGLRDLPRLAASFDITRSGRDGLHVTGEVSSIVVQECIVTLEPIEQNLIEPFELTFVPSAIGAAETVAETSLAGNDESEPPEPMSGGSVDLGAIATEYFLLGIDPYPRKPGAKFEDPNKGDSAVESPFAALAALKKSKPGERG